MPGAGNLFVKTHPKSKNLWADLPMNPERENAESVYVYNLGDLSKAPVKLDVAKQELHPAFCWFHPRPAAVPGAGRNGGQVNPGLKHDPDQVEADFGPDLGRRMEGGELFALTSPLLATASIIMRR